MFDALIEVCEIKNYVYVSKGYVHVSKSYVRVSKALFIGSFLSRVRGTYCRPGKALVNYATNCLPPVRDTCCQSGFHPCNIAPGHGAI